ncbi:helix-turn-helix domain-containing protein [Saprospiraceae bacterium]|jgi:transcriptional regulator with XRE-family HTH domain|nr:helix-turn-helix domain-containing protein [Saprospiraceae bacterium]
MNFGEKIRFLREDKGMIIRELAASLKVDTSTISKIENSQRHATKKQVKDLAIALNADFLELEAHWMGSKIYEMLQDISNPTNALIAAEEQVHYRRLKK